MGAFAAGKKVYITPPWVIKELAGFLGKLACNDLHEAKLMADQRSRLAYGYWQNHKKEDYWELFILCR